MAAYNILEARNNLSCIIASVEFGTEEAVIMRRGRARGARESTHAVAQPVGWGSKPSADETDGCRGRTRLVGSGIPRISWS
ncbi:hypothetical protein [Microbacterium sp. CPCC 204701]|uniref:hypothetical protein n=1 Tax=Microbacterium sp. CPCC 204701 TaxID=2493084 RepID=UPI000FD78271|nr:hypothetical protein [Microbacterium sp. CPCC 204701]